MKVLVTGHLGYIGTVLVPLLLSRGYKVIGLDTDLFKTCSFAGEINAVENMGKDIRDVTVSDLKGFDAVIHLAGVSNDSFGDLNPEITYEINYKASVELARLSKGAGIPRFIFSSSCSVYGNSGKEAVNENSKINPLNPYSKSKALAERGIRELADQNFSPTILRNATVYGISPKLRLDLVLNNLTASAVTTGRVSLRSDGKAYRPLVHVEDLAEAFIAILKAQRDKVHDKVFNVGLNKENFKVIELAEMVADAAPGSKIEYAKSGFTDPRSYNVDFGKISHSFPNLKFKWTVGSGTRELCDSYVSFGLKAEDGARFKRIDRIKALLAEGKLSPKLRWGK